jgi:hypothetical protein
VLFKGELARGTAGLVGDWPTPTMVALSARAVPTDEEMAGAGPGSRGSAPADASPAPVPEGSVTRKECPHFGHLIFRPVGGTRRSSI